MPTEGLCSSVGAKTIDSPNDCESSISDIQKTTNKNARWWPGKFNDSTYIPGCIIGTANGDFNRMFWNEHPTGGEKKPEERRNPSYQICKYGA